MFFSYVQALRSSICSTPHKGESLVLPLNPVLCTLICKRFTVFMIKMVPRSKYDLQNPAYLKVPKDIYERYKKYHGDRWAEQARYILELAMEAFE